MAESITRKNIDLDILDYYDGKIKVYVDDKVGTGGLTIDDTLSDTSTNPVQNKVVKQAIDNKADKTVATISADGLMSAEDKSKLDDADNTYALKSKYGDTTIDVGRKAGTTVGKYSTAEGYSTTASGDYSHAEGAGTTASDSRSHAEGYLCTASSDNSHAEGNNTTASGTHSHSEGDNTIASGIGSHAGGASSIASSDYSFAHGMHVESNNSCEVSLGKFNKSSSDTLFSVGDGASESARHNAFEITTTGGKLHDKDIATTDLIPTELPANGGNADTVGGLAANEIATNPNLLINPDFRINQQGKSEYTGTSECWDKWIVNAGWGTVRSDDDLAALFTCVTPQVNSWVVNQNIPNYKDYRGKTVTFSAQIVTASTKFCLMINDGVDQLAIPVTTGHFSVTYTVSDNATQLQCVICTDGQESKNEQIGVFSTKLELGTIATTFVPPNPAIEIAKVRAANNYKPYVTGTLSEQASDSPVTLGFEIFDFTPSKVICQCGNGNAFFANVITNGFSLTIPAGTTTIHYIAFK